MAVDITVYPYLSPRIIEIVAPQTECSIQELVDAIREWEDSEFGSLFPYLMDAAGKFSLGGGRYTGITLELQNARIKFTARTTPLDSGVGSTCDATDTSGQQLYVNDADFVTDGVYPGATVFNASTMEMAVITEVVDQYTLNHFALSGNGGLGWTSGDNYMVYPNVQCTLTGGNLVSVDDVGAELSPVFQSANVQVAYESSTSAALLDSAASGPTSAEIADAVWDEAIEDHDDAGSTGRKLRRLKTQRQ